MALLLEVSVTNCEHDGTKLLDNLHLFLEESDASVPYPSTNHVTGTDDAVPVDVTLQVQQKEGIKCDMKLL
jgi:hypothetical protein